MTEHEVSISSVRAAAVGVDPALIRGFENEGYMYFTWADRPSVGAQCAQCNSIVWVNQRKNAVLSEVVPSSVPDSGPAYRAYHEDNIRRFLLSVPPCPKCDGVVFDRFVNNVSFPRFPSGLELREDMAGSDILKVDAENVEVFHLD